MGQGVSSDARLREPVITGDMVLHPTQLSDGLKKRLRRSKLRENDYSLVSQARLEIFKGIELPKYYPIWAANEERNALAFRNVPYHFGYGFVFGMAWSLPVDFYQGCKASNWRLSGGVGRVRRQTHFQAGRFAEFLGLLYFYETVLFKLTARHGKEETTIAAFFTAGTLVIHHGPRVAAMQGAVAAAFMFCLTSFTEYVAGKAGSV
ncbi:hypothetical protein DIPPA_03187 [Diplonema papillatum]|nr:hypothetical protein DIPPA_03187 [Diplonema papillatum]|eukprot:gene16046-24569_t